MIFIFSLARSGSTWLGKIFDSHPDVFYLHEPGVDDRGLDLVPDYWFPGEPGQRDIENARLYIKRLTGNRSLRATGTLPIFRKNYRSSAAHIARGALILLAKGWEQLGLLQRSTRIRVPDFSFRDRKKVVVIKSVSGMGLAEAFIRGGGTAFRPVLLLRHPYSYVSSMLRGHNLGLLKLPVSLGRLLETRSAVRLGATHLALTSPDAVELLAWDWLLQNAEAHCAIAAAGGITIKYEDLAARPLQQTKFVFEQVGLALTEQTEGFLASAANRTGGYYSVYRHPSDTVDGWRRFLDENAVSRIRDIVAKDVLGRGYVSD